MNLKRFFQLLLLLMLIAAFSEKRCEAQTSSVTAVVTGSDGQGWKNGTYAIHLQPSSTIGLNVGSPINSNSGTPATIDYTGSLDASANLSVTIQRTDFISPVNYQYRFTICPQATSQCFQFIAPVTGTNSITSGAVSLTSIFSNLPISVKSTGTGLAKAYVAGEVSTSAIGNQYWDLTQSALGTWNGSSWIFPLSTGSSNNFTTYQYFASGPICDITSPTYGADPTGIVDSTTAINLALSACAGLKGITYFPPGTYKVIPATVDNGADTETGAFPMLSNMHILGSKGAKIRLADNQSTNAVPKRLSLFFTNSALNNIRFDCAGLQMDMNGANNQISPARPTTYNIFDQSMIHVSGDSARIDDMYIGNCQFLNTAGSNPVVAAESNTPGIVLGRRWIVENNLFLNNGLDTSDETSFYGWADYVNFHDNLCWQDSPYGTVGHTGSQTCFEVHGAYSDYHDNNVRNYYRGAYMANNYTSLVTHSSIHDNVFNTMYVGVDLFNSNSSGGNNGNSIYNNTFNFDDSTFSGAGAPIKVAVQLVTSLAISDLDIFHNHMTKTGTTIDSGFFLASGQNINQPYTNIRVDWNSIVGARFGIQWRNQVVAQSLGYFEAIGNEFNSFYSMAGTPSIGIYTQTPNGAKTIILSNNRCIDEQAVPTFNYCFYLDAGNITDLAKSNNFAKGMTINNVNNLATVTNNLTSF